MPAWNRKLRVAGFAIAGQKITVEVDGDDIEISGTGDVQGDPRTAHAGRRDVRTVTTPQDRHGR